MPSRPTPVTPLPRLYAIVDAELSAAEGWDVPEVAEAMMRGGARLIQLRAKSAPSAAVLAWAEAVVALGARYGATVVVNDRADLARLAGAGGVHVGQDDLPAAAARQIVGPEALVGLSTHTLTQFEAALGELISYAAVGPVYGTVTKAEADAVVGLELVEQAAGRTGGMPGIAIVAIGGITVARAGDVIAAGATAVAVISDLLVGGDPERRTAEFLEALENA
jgi:thiamine-phosphate pyrophosphorylase